MKYIVKYILPEGIGDPGGPREREAGPYTADEVHAHARDIEGFRGITNVRIELVPEETK